jgi:hypothetical protein
MTAKDAYIRYMRFKDVSFGALPPEHHLQAYQDLLVFERGLVYGDAIGEVVEFEFGFEIFDDSIIREKPIPYARNERQWIKEYCDKMCELGILKKLKPGEEEPRFVVGAVLVKEGQS